MAGRGIFLRNLHDPHTPEGLKRNRSSDRSRCFCTPLQRRLSRLATGTAVPEGRFMPLASVLRCQGNWPRCSHTNFMRKNRTWEISIQNASSIYWFRWMRRIISTRSDDATDRELHSTNQVIAGRTAPTRILLWHSPFVESGAGYGRSASTSGVPGNRFDFRARHSTFAFGLGSIWTEDCAGSEPREQNVSAPFAVGTRAALYRR